MEVAGSGSLNGPLVEVGAFNTTIAWSPDATQEDMTAAMPFIEKLVNEVNGENANVPPVISEIVIKRN